MTMTRHYPFLRDPGAVVGEVARIAARAGRCVEACAGGGVERKADGSPATAADRAADDLLRAALLDLAPGGWLSEETADSADRLGQDLVWIVDPLDGTKEFVARVPEYTVAIALVWRGRPQLAVVHNPATDETVTAVRGGGTFANGEPVRVRPGRHLLASRTELRSGEFEPFAAEWDISALGSIQYKLARVASGVAAVTLSRGPKHEWDVCAGALLVEEAGGQVTDLFGAPLRFNRPLPKTAGILAGDPGAVARAAALILDVGGSERMGELQRV